MADRRASRPRPSAAPRPFAWSRGGRTLLRGALEEAVSLLEADGGLVYLATAPDGELAHLLAVGIGDAAQLRRIRARRMRRGTGLFGRAVTERRVTGTGDYLADPSFVHAPGPDDFVRALGIRSMIVAPLIAADRLLGAMGVHSERADAFLDDHLALVGVLAEHAAGAIRQGELVAALDDSRRELARRIHVERTLRDISTELSRDRESEAVLQTTIDAAAQLLGADGARIDLFEQRPEGIRWREDRMTRNHPAVSGEPPGGVYLGGGISGRAVADGRPFWTGDYLADERFTHIPDTDAWVRENGIHSAICAAVGAPSAPLGVLTAFSARPDQFGPADAEVLEALADRAAIAIGDMRLISALRDSQQALAEQAAVDKALREINAEIFRSG